MVNDIGGHRRRQPDLLQRHLPQAQGVLEAGKIHLGSLDALAFSRIRHDLLRGDFDRSANQQRVLRGIQAKIRERAGAHGFIEKRRAVGDRRTWRPTPRRPSSTGWPGPRPR